MMVKPDYPKRAQDDCEEGDALVRFQIGPGGITSAEIAQSSGFEQLDALALDAIRASHCAPPLLDGAPQTVIRTIPYQFHLSRLLHDACLYRRTHAAAPR
jgi:periplasmic protein TonB